MSTLKVAFLTEIISPYRIPVLNCLAQDSRLDLQVFFFAETESRRAWRVPKEQIKFSYKVLPGILVGRAYQQGPLLFNPGILTELIRGNYDCVIVGGYYHPTFWLALAYARLTGKRCLLWSESTLRDQRHQNLLKERFKQFLVQQMTGYIVPGTAQIDYLLSLGAATHQIWIAPNSVDPQLFGSAVHQRSLNQTQLKQQLGIEGPVLLYVGRLLDDKGIPDLLNAFEQICQRIPSANLVLVGDGPDRQAYQQHCQHRGLTRTFFPGFQQQDVLPDYYAIADLFLFPTHSDPWGLVINEAMWAGLPIICSHAAGAAADLVKSGDNGFLHEPGDIAAISEYTSRLIQDRTLRTQMGLRSQQIIQNYTPEIMAHGFAAAILELPPSTPVLCNAPS